MFLILLQLKLKLLHDQFGTFSLGAVSLGGAQRFAAAARGGPARS
jgi:hypothetical protein